ncbi:MAG: BMP family ABC transporter substrate-binding protein, partial [Oscillospiraceae bacterium]|nr:BMP family ABC transporter substrate-binding protein [Oscillospiraceae bacterium]
MKKFLALILALVMALALVACGGNGGQTETPDGSKEPDNTQTTDTFKVGFITLHDENSTYDLNFINAAKAACETLGVECIIKTGVPESNDCYQAALDLVDEGCGFVFA